MGRQQRAPRPCARGCGEWTIAAICDDCWSREAKNPTPKPSLLDPAAWDDN